MVKSSDRQKSFDATFNLYPEHLRNYRFVGVRGKADSKAVIPDIRSKNMQDLEEGKFCPLKKYGESAGFWIIHKTLSWGRFSSKASAIIFAQSLGWQEFHIGFGGVKFFQYKPQLFAKGWQVANVLSQQ